MKTTPRNYTALVLTVCLTLLPALSQARTAPAPRPQVDVVFVIDTTGSMSGLIQGAKQKVWSIVNEIAAGRPSPQIRLGLVAYRDKGDDYITQSTDLSLDLDAVYEKLMAFEAGGGGDGPEHVNQALSDAVTKMSWSQDRRALKMIFLVGDAPPHMDYNDDTKYSKTCKQAVRKDIIINTIQCGEWAEATKPFRDIAYRSEGRFMAIAQSGGTVTLATPFDGQISELSGKLDATFIAYGAAPARSEAKARVKKAQALAESAAPAAAADRASYRAGSGGMGHSDLLGALNTGAADLDKLDDAELPAELQGKTRAEQTALLKTKQAERQQIQAQILDLSQQRNAYIQQEMKKRGGDKDSFDAQVLESIRAKAVKKGIEY
jgi:Mg-chelatase subunit ChlD